MRGLRREVSIPSGAGTRRAGRSDSTETDIRLLRLTGLASADNSLQTQYQKLEGNRKHTRVGINGNSNFFTSTENGGKNIEKRLQQVAISKLIKQQQQHVIVCVQTKWHLCRIALRSTFVM